MLKKIIKHQPDFIDQHCPWVSKQTKKMADGNVDAAIKQLQLINPKAYCRTRNYLAGDVTFLSAYIRHGMLSLNQVSDYAKSLVDNTKDIEKFIQELAWRDFWQRIYYHYPDYITSDIEPYKTGFLAADYQQVLPTDIDDASTPNACINQFITQLKQTGYLHNHARMYLASYIVHWKRICWQAGARWMHHYLVDGDLASNHLSWQWVASTFSNKPYIFNLDNVRKYADSSINTSSVDNPELDYSYEVLSVKLFPNIGAQS